MTGFRRILAVLAASFLMMSPLTAAPVAAAAPKSHCDDMGNTSSKHHDRATQALTCCVATAAPMATAVAAELPELAVRSSDPMCRGDRRVPGGQWGTDPPPPRLR